jgi:hypothetical protein
MYKLIMSLNAKVKGIELSKTKHNVFKINYWYHANCIKKGFKMEIM